MKYFTAAIVLTLVATSVAFGGNQPSKNPSPLTEDEIAIYKVLLRNYASDAPGSLNVSVKTDPLDTESNMNGLKNGECLKGIELENLSAVAHTYHELTVDILPGKNMKLVDPEKQVKVVRRNDPSRTIRNGRSVDSAVKDAFATGLFTVSEIAFDKARLRGSELFLLVRWALWSWIDRCV